jgi:hypothetical protein
MGDDIPAARLRSWVTRQIDSFRTDPERRGAVIILAVTAVLLVVLPFVPFPNP